MLLIRRMEEKHGELLASGKYWMMSHFGTGQEAIAVGITAPLAKEDYAFPTHRGFGVFIGKGLSPTRKASFRLLEESCSRVTRP